jgi:hypothetical protein
MTRAEKLRDAVGQGPEPVFYETDPINVLAYVSTAGMVCFCEETQEIWPKDIPKFIEWLDYWFVENAG